MTLPMSRKKGILFQCIKSSYLQNIVSDHLFGKLLYQINFLCKLLCQIIPFCQTVHQIVLKPKYQIIFLASCAPDHLSYKLLQQIILFWPNYAPGHLFGKLLYQISSGVSGNSRPSSLFLEIPKNHKGGQEFPLTPGSSFQPNCAPDHHSCKLLLF